MRHGLHGLHGVAATSTYGEGHQPLPPWSLLDLICKQGRGDINSCPASASSDLTARLLLLMLLLYELLHCSAIGSPTAGLGPRPRPKPAFSDWLVGFWASRRGAANRGAGGGSLVQLGPIVRPLPSLGLAQPAISSFLLLHPRFRP
jgi:hypothetical protein